MSVDILIPCKDEEMEASRGCLDGKGQGAGKRGGGLQPVRLCCRRDTALPPSGGVLKPSVSGAVSVGRWPGCRCTGGRELQRWQCLVIRPEAVLVEIY